MQFGKANGTIEQTDRCRPLQFSPAALAVPLSQKGKNADTAGCGYPFHVDNIANDFELHRRPLYSRYSLIQERANSPRSPAGAIHAFSINHFFFLISQTLGQDMAWRLKKTNA